MTDVAQRLRRSAGPIGSYSSRALLTFVTAICSPVVIPALPANSASGEPGQRSSAIANGALTVLLCQGVDDQPNLIHPWPRWHGELSGGYGDLRAQTVTIEIPGGRRFSQRSFETDINQFSGHIDMVSMKPMRRRSPLSETLRSLRQVFRDWKVEPKGDVAVLLREMEKAIPFQGNYHGTVAGVSYPAIERDNPHSGYWGGGQAAMSLSPDAELFAQVRYWTAGDEGGLYTIYLEIHAARQWYEAAARQRAGRALVAQPAKMNGAPLTIALFQDADAVGSLAKPWPKMFGTPIGQLDDPHARTVTVKVPDGRTFSSWTSQTGIGRFDDKLNSVTLWPLDSPQPLHEAVRVIEDALARWKLEPKGKILWILQDLRRAIPRQGQWSGPVWVEADGRLRTATISNGGPFRGYWYAEKGAMKINDDIGFSLEVRPVLSHGDSYTVKMGFSATAEWYDAQRRMAATTRPSTRLMTGH